MKKNKLFFFLICLLCLSLFYSGCSSGVKKTSQTELSQLREEYSYVSMTPPDSALLEGNFDPIPSMKNYAAMQATAMAVVEITGNYTTKISNISPFEEEDPEMLIPSSRIVFLPVKVLDVVAGEDPAVTVNADLLLHLGNAEFINNEFWKAMQPGRRYIVSLIPSIGRLSQQYSAENVFTSVQYATMYLTEDDIVLPFEEGGALDAEYGGCKLEDFKPEMEYWFDEWAKLNEQR